MTAERTLLALLTLGVWLNLFMPAPSNAHDDQYIYAYQIYDLESTVESIAEEVTEGCTVNGDVEISDRYSGYMSYGDIDC